MLTIMKQGVHPQYYPDAKVKCACGNEFTTGSTIPEINIEVCSNCHPFYTGKDKLLDTRGRLEKFKKRQEKSSSFIMASKNKPAKKSLKKTKKTKTK